MKQSKVTSVVYYVIITRRVFQPRLHMLQPCSCIYSIKTIHNYSKGTTDTHKLFKALHTCTILSTVGISPLDFF